jgi:NADH-quinone oxidoreductase subunit F
MSKLKQAFEKYGVSVRKPNANGAVLFIGTLPSKDNEKLMREVCQNCSKLIYFSPMEDLLLHDKAAQYIKYEAGSEAGVLALLAKTLLNCKKLESNVANYIDGLDEGYLSAESNVGEEEIAKSATIFYESDLTLLLGDDLKTHPDAYVIASLIALIKKFFYFHVSMVDASELEVKNDFLLPPIIEEISSFDGTVVYFYPQDVENEKLLGSSQFAMAAKIQDKDEIIINVKSGEYKKIFEVSDKLKGTIAILGLKEPKGYRYEVAKVMKRVANG